MLPRPARYCHLAPAPNNTQKIIIPSITAVPMSGSITINKTASPDINRGGIIPNQKLVSADLFRSNHEARYKITASLTNSDGWNQNGPRLNQLLLLPTRKPTFGSNTRAKAKNPASNIQKDHFFQRW